MSTVATKDGTEVSDKDDVRATGLRSHTRGEEARWRRAFATR